MKSRAKRPSPMLKERLIDDEVEGEPPPSAAERARVALEESIKEWRLDRPAESPEERSARIYHHKGTDQLVFPVFVAVVAASLTSCAFVMMTYSSDIFYEHIIYELLFALSVIQGPLAVYQRLQLVAMRSKRDEVATLWSEVKSLKESADGKSSEIISMRKDIGSLNESISKYSSCAEGYGHSEIVDLYHENETINTKKKLLAEAMGIQKLTRSILETDNDKDHYVGDAELRLLAQRIESIEGVPFASYELCERFKQDEEARSLRNLADMVRILYVEKRREHKRAKAREGRDRSPRNIGTPVLWKRNFDGMDITVC